MAREHWGKKKDKAIHERRTFRGLQIIPIISFYDESQGHKPGEKNWKKFGFDLHPQVSLAAAGLVLLFIVISLVFKEESAAFFQHLLNGIGNSFGWFYILSANIFVIVMLLVAVSDNGKLRIGGPDALPEFSSASWYAMLISAGMGIGLMFWSVAEPVFHYMTPSPMFDVPAQSAQSAQVALGLTYYHWGIHPWGIYALVGLSLAFFAYNRGLPLTIFFVTSSDSGSLVVDHLTSGGKLDSPIPQRVFWGVMEGLCAAALLMGGGLVALQSASIATGLPFTIVLLIICYSLYRGLKEEHFYATIIGKLQPEKQRVEIPVDKLGISE